VLLLTDIKTVFDTLEYEKLATERLVLELCNMGEAPWSSIRRGEPLDARGLAVRLGRYGIGSKPQRLGAEVFKGYSRAQFEDAWKRYLPTHLGPNQSVTPVTEDTSELVVTDVTAESPRGRHGFVPPHGEGRCDICGCHIELQGHSDGCPEREAS
jgi:hypothetical protein